MLGFVIIITDFSLKICNRLR